MGVKAPEWEQLAMSQSVVSRINDRNISVLIFNDGCLNGSWGRMGITVFTLALEVIDDVAHQS